MVLTRQQKDDMDMQKTLRSAKQTAFDATLKETDAFITKDLEEKEATELEALLEQLKETFDDILKRDEDIEAKVLATGEKDDLTAEITSVSTQKQKNRIGLMRVRKAFERYKAKTTAKSSVAASATTPTSKTRTAQLPKLRLPFFDGSYTQFTSFWEIIQSDVLSGDYSDITKFNYIFGQLRGTAAEAVRGIHASGENLNNLVEILKDRFGKKRKIIRAHVANILDYPVPSFNHAALNRFYNQIYGDLRSLEHLGVNLEECASFIVPILERKVPKQMMEKMGTCGQGDIFALKLFLGSFSEHLENNGEQHETTSENKHRERNQRSNPSSTESFVSTSSSGSNRTKRCAFCDGDHFPV